MSIEILYTATIQLSQSYDFNMTRNQIIEQAYSRVGGKSDGQSLTNEQYQRAAELLNAMIKKWSAEDIFVFHNKWTNLLLKPSDFVSVSGIDYECIRNNTGDARNQPGIGEAFLSFWKPISSVGAPAWVEGNNYHGKGDYYLDSNIIEITEMRIRQNTDSPGSFISVTPMTEREYFAMGDTLSEGKPDRYLHRRQCPNEIVLFPVPEDVSQYTIEMIVQQYAEDMDSGSDNPDFCQEYIDPLVSGLAVELAPSEGIFGGQLGDLRSMAEKSKNDAMNSNHDSGDVRISPNLRSY
jgi:hypothetical protein